MYSFVKMYFRGAWVAQSVKHPTAAQVMITRSVSWRPVWGSGLTAQSLGPALDSVSVCLSVSLSLSLSLSALSLLVLSLSLKK